MKRIGILTFHRANNFGAFLQVYALQEYLKCVGNEVVIIDYRNKAIEDFYNVWDFSFIFKRKNIFKSIALILNKIKTFNQRKLWNDKYESIRNSHLNISSEIYFGEKDFKGGYDVYICGSDQIWNARLTNKLDPVYFLNFCKNDKSKKISYAASSEIYAYGCFAQQSNELHKYLDNFDAISVRENILAEELRKYTNKEITTVLDPTFLFDKTFYESLIKEPVIRNYVLVYHLYESEESSFAAKKIAQERNLSVVEIHAGFTNNIKNNHKQGLDSLEILGYIYYADLIFATSFHGMALSLVLNKQFYIVNKGDNSRMRNLLESLNISERMINSVDDINSNEIDFANVNKLLLYQKEQSKSFLQSNL
ncbi:MAG: polysaccharide pyruvyl transferase family protein [Candidatus Azobacteroides sp.]|nr:polysaccharide pyruvyl transferase family protein [Candidatus Azobacteroides sp.]